MVYFNIIDYDGNKHNFYSIEKLQNRCVYDNIKIMEIWGEEIPLPNNFKLPSKLKVLKCRSLINKFPELPDTLEELECINNGLQWRDNPNTFPKLPESLKIFKSEFNQIWFPPELPNGLIKLNLSGNGLISLTHDEKGYNKKLPDNLE